MDYNPELTAMLEQANQPVSIQEYGREIERQEKLNAILEMAKNAAVTKGMNYQMNEIRQAIAQKERELDAIYNFSPLLIQGKVVPPVITEAKDVLQNPDELTIKTTGAVYKITTQARFATTSPNWRAYLTFPQSSEESILDGTMTADMLPKNAKERKKWRETTIASFNQGVVQANNILKHSLNRLNRDYIGMSRFHEFVLAGKVSLPSISSQSLAVASTASAISLDQRLLTIRTLPSFDANIDKWATWVTTVSHNPSGEQATINKVD